MARRPTPPSHEAEEPVSDAAPLTRRARRRLETRQSLIAAAIDLFEEFGYDEVTVAQIADRADVDSSTFFRHFGSREAVVFADITDFMDGIGAALDARPEGESLLDAITAALLDVGDRRGFDSELEHRRAQVIASADSLLLQSASYRELSVRELTAAIARRLGVDPDDDSRPYLAATVWVAALDFVRRRSVTHPPRVQSDLSLDAVVHQVRRMLEPVWPSDPGWR